MSEKMKYQAKQVMMQLRQELELKDLKRDCEQWVLGVSIRQESEALIARVAVAVSDTDLVDGMDIRFDETDGGVVMDAEYWEQAPDFEGGTVSSALEWMQSGGVLIYFSALPPEQYGNTIGAADGND